MECPRDRCWGLSYLPFYIDDLEEGAECRVTKFADDTKMSGKANCAEGVESLQRDLDRLSEWARTWQMEYNVSKCEVSILVEIIVGGIII